MTHFIESYGLWVVFVVVYIEVAGLPFIPGEAALIAAAALASQGHVSVQGDLARSRARHRRPRRDRPPRCGPPLVAEEARELTRSFALALLVLALAACGASAWSPPAEAPPATRVPDFTHVVVVVF